MDICLWGQPLDDLVLGMWDELHCEDLNATEIESFSAESLKVNLIVQQIFSLNLWLFDDTGSLTRTWWNTELQDLQ